MLKARKVREGNPVAGRELRRRTSPRRFALVMLLGVAGLCGCTAAPPPSEPLPLGEKIAPPAGWISYCRRHDLEDVACVRLTQERWGELQRVNSEVNRRVAYRSDRTLYGTLDLWTVAAEAGDCEDFALAKRQQLVRLGWPASALLLATGRTPRGVYHAVLVAVTDRGDYVLDNNSDLVSPWAESAIVMDRLEVPGRAYWRQVVLPSHDEPTPASTAVAELRPLFPKYLSSAP